MRTHRAWIHMVAMLALLLGFIPTSAIAPLQSTNCKMACCVGKPAHKMADPDCLKACDGANSDSSNPGANAQERQSDGCKCSIGSSPSSLQPEAVSTSTYSLQIEQVVADVPAKRDLVPPFAEAESRPGIYCTDSGPPTSRPNYVSLGRAPPVFLA